MVQVVKEECQMNINYLFSSNGKLVVSDENGIIKERCFKDNYYASKILVKENELEIINNKLDSLYKEEKETKNNIISCKKFMKILPIIVSLGTLVYFVYGGLLCGIVGLAFNSIVTSMYFLFLNSYASKLSKDVINLDNTIEKANILRDNCIEEMEKMKDLKLNKPHRNEQVNQSISLEKKNTFIFNKVESELNAPYESICNGKKLVLKNKHNK